MRKAKPKGPSSAIQSSVEFLECLVHITVRNEIRHCLPPSRKKVENVKLILVVAQMILYQLVDLSFRSSGSAHCCVCLTVRARQDLAPCP